MDRSHVSKVPKLDITGNVRVHEASRRPRMSPGWRQALSVYLRDKVALTLVEQGKA